MLPDVRRGCLRWAVQLPGDCRVVQGKTGERRGGRSCTGMIARVFPRRTAMTPRDGLAFFKEPTIENIADCIKADVTEVHISVTFTWDILRAEDLYYAWQILGVPVEVGGPAFDDRMGDFTPGCICAMATYLPHAAARRTAGSALCHAAHEEQSASCRSRMAGTFLTTTYWAPASSTSRMYARC